MPQRLALASRIATATCACPRRWANPAPDRWFEPLPPPPLTGLQVNFGLPRLCRPPSSPQDCGRELSLCFRERKRKRRQSRTGHGRTRHKGRPPGPPAYPPLSPQIPLAGRLCDVAEAIYDHRVASRRRPQSGPLAGPCQSAKRAGEKNMRHPSRRGAGARNLHGGSLQFGLLGRACLIKNKKSRRVRRVTKKAARTLLRPGSSPSPIGCAARALEVAAIRA